MKNNRLLLPLLLLLSCPALAQTITLRTGAVTAPPNIFKSSVDSFNALVKPFAGQRFAVLQFSQIPSATSRQSLTSAGITLLDYLDKNTYAVSISGALSLPALQAAGAKAFFSLSAQQKMADYLAAGRLPAWAVKVQGTVDVWISFPKTLAAATVLAAIQAQNIELLSTAHIGYNVIALRIAANRLTEVAAFPFVEYLQAAPPPAQPLNYNSRTGSRATALNASGADGGKGLNGEGIVIGVGDNADLQNHADFQGRLINRNPAGFNAHGVHVAGTAAGAGNINELYRGYAPRATIFNQAFSGVLDNAATYVQDYGMVITNNSYGNIIDCEYHGTYDLYSRIMDQQAFQLPNLVHVFSAGNSGATACAPYTGGYHTVIGSYQSAKNVVTVGATTDSGAISGFSSRGPVKDGRIKPEITAMGQQVASAWPTNGYAWNNGTSMSAPAVSGGLALLYQQYKKLNGGANPPNALMKALLCNGASDRGIQGPDFQYGFGWMNLLRSVETIDSNRYFSGAITNGATATQTITIPANTARLKLMLYWNDVPASIISTKTLVNDLDLELVTPSAATIYPQLLDTASLGTAATTGPDHVNNMEQVVITNPAPGTYTIAIKGGVITNAAQDYVVVYDVVPTGIKVAAPAGGQGLVPGEYAKISWDAYGLSGACAIDFSADGGAIWSPVASGVDVTRPVYTWAVPAAATATALVRITHGASGTVAVSSPFVILGQPTVSLAAVQCEGYINLGWTAITGATDYEVMVLRSGGMTTIDSATGTTYSISGLSTDTTYWVTVRPRINGKAGRRAVAIARQPVSGTCAGSLSDNDLKLDAILWPKTGRVATSTALTATNAVTVRLKNLDDAPVSNFTVSYTLNGTMITENVNTTIAAGATYIHTFATTAALSAEGAYTITAAVTAATTDANKANDTATVTVRQLANNPLNLTTPFVDNIEAALPAEYGTDTTGLYGIDRYDFTRSTVYGRARTFVNTGIALSGSKAITLDMNQNNGATNTSYLYGTFNLSGYTTATDVRLDFWYLNHNQQPAAGNRVWVRGNDAQPWIETFKLDSAQAFEGQYKKAGSIELSNLLAANGQTFSSSTGIRWGQVGQLQTTDRENGAGYTFDDIRLYTVANDVQVVRITAPQQNNCALSAATPVQITVRNPSAAAIANVPVSLVVNGTVVSTETIATIAANSSVTYTFTTPANLAATGAYTIKAIAGYSGDSFAENDTASAVVYNQPVISLFPYLQNFESGNGGFYSLGKKPSWEFGTPNSRKISGAASGAGAWKTRSQGGYNDNEISYLYSPCFDVSGLASPTLSFSLALDLEDCGLSLCDGAWVEYSADGVSWTKLGTAGTGTNWYNKATQQVWSVENYTYWHVASQPLPTGLSRLRLRFVMASDAGVNREGIAIDDIHIYDNTLPIYDGVTMAGPSTQTVAGNGWVNVLSGGKIVAALQPSGQSLGATDVQAYINTGAVRTYNNQYYHHRNITIKPAVNPADSVAVRFYFLDAETENLLKANGCATCAKPASAYELGVSKYTDADKAVENGTVADNSGGVWRFIAPATVAKVPYDKGYYAEFKTVGFSEFWLSKGGLSNLQALPVKLVDFTARRQGPDVAVQWTVASETGVQRYDVELARGNTALTNNSFGKIGEMRPATTGNALQTYHFTDGEAGKSGVRFYRLKIIHIDGTVTYSAVKAVVFTDAVQWQVYPNPSAGVFALQYQLSTGDAVVAKLYDSKGSVVKEYRATATGFTQKLVVDITGGFANGVYLLLVSAGGKTETFKLYKQ